MFCHGQYFGVDGGLAWLMLWCGRSFSVVNVLTCRMFWHVPCYGMVHVFFMVHVFLWSGRGGAGANPLLPNSSETAKNFETPFYRKEDGSMRMVYVYFHKPICPL